MSAPVCRLCGSNLDPGSDLTRHILAESCIKAHGERLERLEDALRAFLPGSGALEQPVQVGTCEACGKPFPRHRSWARFCSTACRHRNHSDRRPASPGRETT